MTRYDLACRLRMLRNQLAAGELSWREYRLLRRGAALAYTLERPLRRRARRAVQSAVEAGLIIRPERCEGCGCECKPEAHHADHRKPLTVDWLCPGCHDKADREAALAPGGAVR